MRLQLLAACGVCVCVCVFFFFCVCVCVCSGWRRRNCRAVGVSLAWLCTAVEPEGWHAARPARHEPGWDFFVVPITAKGRGFSPAECHHVESPRLRYT